MHDDGVLCVSTLLAEECKPVDVLFSLGSDFFLYLFFHPDFQRGKLEEAKENIIHLRTYWRQYSPRLLVKCELKRRRFKRKKSLVM